MWRFNNIDVIRKQCRIAKQIKKNTPGNWSNITIGSMRQLKKKQKKYKTIFFTKRYKELIGGEGYNLWINNYPEKNTNRVILQNRQYKNKWLKQLHSKKNIRLNQIFIPKNHIRGQKTLQLRVIILIKLMQNINLCQIIKNES